jgi:hypothetical protein
MKEWKAPELLVLDVEYTESTHHGETPDGFTCQEPNGGGHGLTS